MAVNRLVRRWVLALYTVAVVGISAGFPENRAADHAGYATQSPSGGAASSKPAAPAWADGTGGNGGGTPFLVGAAASATSASAVAESPACTENSLPHGDDGGVAIDLPFRVDFGGPRTRLIVNNNGNVTFGWQTDANTATSSNAGNPVIAPFWADIDTTFSTAVQYGYGDDVFENKPAFCVNWVNVGRGSYRDYTYNSFQLLLVPRPDAGSRAYDIVFNYSRIAWDYGAMPSAPALAGYSLDGTWGSAGSREISGSGIRGAFVDTNATTGLIHQHSGSATPGRFVFAMARPTACAADADCDGLDDSVEARVGTDMKNDDTDGDGLLDSWEVDPEIAGSGIRLPGGEVVSRNLALGEFGPGPDGNCIAADKHLRLPPAGTSCLNREPDPLHKDIYLEIDWQDCLRGGCPWAWWPGVDPLHHAPSGEGLVSAVRALANAPAPNPDNKSGINLNIRVDERLEHAPNCATADRADNAGRRNFGTPAQRQGSPLVLQARALMVRYVWSGHSSVDAAGGCPTPGDFVTPLQGLGLAELPSYDWSPFGSVNLAGDYLLVTLGPLWLCPSRIYGAFSTGRFGVCYRESRQYQELFWVDPGVFPAKVSPAGGAAKDVRYPIGRLLGERETDAAAQLWSRTLVHLLGHAVGILDEENVRNEPAPAGRVQSNRSPLPPLQPENWNAAWESLRFAPTGAGARRLEEHGPNYDTLSGLDPDLDDVPESDDNCPGVWNPEQKNADGVIEVSVAEMGDDCDNDIDGDGLLNTLPPGSAARETPRGIGADTPEDPLPYDTDNDGAPNDSDMDDDDDAAADSADDCPLTPDRDQHDQDHDDLGDACDADADGDGYDADTEVLSGSDPANAVSTPELLGAGNCGDGYDNDTDHKKDADDSGCLDRDGDGLPDSVDRCSSVASPNNGDRDDDGVGDVCDLLVEVVSVSPEFPRADTTRVTLTFTATAAASFTVRRGGTAACTGTKLDGGTYAADTAQRVEFSPSLLDEGRAELEVCVSDAAGATESAEAVLQTDTEPPVASVPELAPVSDTGSSTSDSITRAEQLWFRGTAEPGSSVTLYQDSFRSASTTAGADGQWAVVDGRPVSEGTHLYFVVVSDLMGNATKTSRVVTVDRTPPSTRITRSVKGVSRPHDWSEKPTTTFWFTASEPGISFCTVDEWSSHACTSPVSEYALTGPHTVHIRSQDLAGNLENPGTAASFYGPSTTVRSLRTQRPFPGHAES